jgi:hypothetical protein
LGESPAYPVLVQGLPKLNKTREQIHNTEVIMKLSTTLIPALVLLTGSGWAMAEEESLETLPRFNQVPHFRQVDTDRNGGIDKTEASQVPRLVEVFAQADMDANGWLTQEEYSAVEQASGT